MVISLVILGVLMARVFVWPLAGNAPKYSQVSRESLLKTNEGWTLQFDIINQGSEGASYLIYLSVDGKPYQDSCQINPGGFFTYIHQIASSDVKGGEVLVKITKVGEDRPFEQGTYYLT
jgi:hypothetical protein